MSPDDDPTPADPPADDPLAVLRHDPKTPLTAIGEQMQPARWRVRRMDGPDRDDLLVRPAAVEAAALAPGEQIERLGDGGGE